MPEGNAETLEHLGHY